MSAFWKKELERATKEEGKWRKKAKMVLDRYNDEREEGDRKNSTRFNILWSSVETVRPSLISAVPVPEVRQRYKKKDPVARVAAKILERALEFSLDTYDFIAYGKKVGNDMLLPGRAVSRVRYIPTFEKKTERIPLTMVEEGGEMFFHRPDGGREETFDQDAQGAFINEEKEELLYEEVKAERVPWKWFRIDPCDEWKNCNWVAFGAPFTKDEGLNEFGDKFKKVQIKKSSATDDKGEALKDKVIVWEIWDKRTRKQIFIAEDHDFTLEENKDPLSLENFFPCPEPIYAVENNDTMVPTPEFCLWQDQADELDKLSERISKITDAIKARGAYAGEKKTELQEILTADDNQLVAIDDWMAVIDKGGLDGLISWVPVEQFAKVLQILERQRAVKVQEIFELTGVSDIQRGASDPRETAAAQELKANSGSRRLLTKQQSVQNHFRDVFRLKSEIIAEQFDKETLKLMVGLENDNNELFDEAVKMIKSDAMRIFNVDVETNTTIAADEEREKRGLADAMQAISGYLTAMGPMIQSGMFPMPVAMGLLQDYLRKFRFGRKLDELLEEAAQQPPPEDPAKKQAEEQAAAEKEQIAADQQVEQEKAAAEIQVQQEKARVANEAVMSKMQATITAIAEKMKLDVQVHDQDLVQDEEDHEQELRQKQESHDLDMEIKKAMASAEKRNVERQPEQVN